MAALITGIAHGVGQQVGGSSQHFPGFWGDLDSKKPGSQDLTSSH